MSNVIVVEFFKENQIGDLVNPCGTDWTHIMSDLKTARGARRRVTNKGYAIPKDAVLCKIFRAGDVLREDTYYLLDSFSVKH